MMLYLIMAYPDRHHAGLKHEVTWIKAFSACRTCSFQLCAHSSDIPTSWYAAFFWSQLQTCDRTPGILKPTAYPFDSSLGLRLGYLQYHIIVSLSVVKMLQFCHDSVTRFRDKEPCPETVITAHTAILKDSALLEYLPFVGQGAVIRTNQGLVHWFRVPRKFKCSARF